MTKTIIDILLYRSFSQYLVLITSGNKQSFLLNGKQENTTRLNHNLDESLVSYLYSQKISSLKVFHSHRNTLYSSSMTCWELNLSYRKNVIYVTSFFILVQVIYTAMKYAAIINLYLPSTIYMYQEEKLGYYKLLTDSGNTMLVSMKSSRIIILRKLQQVDIIRNMKVI